MVGTCDASARRAAALRISFPFGAGGAARRSAAEDLDEGPPELDVEGGVDNRVEGAVDVPQPRERAVKPRRDVARPAVGVHYMSDKERQPADEEDSCGGRSAAGVGGKKGERKNREIRRALLM